MFKAMRIIAAALVGVCALGVASTIKANARSLLGLPLKFTAGDCRLLYLLDQPGSAALEMQCHSADVYFQPAFG